MPATGRLRLALIAAAIAAATALALPSVAAARTPSESGATVSPVAAAAADRAPTHLRGWAGSAASVKAGTRFAVHVRISGGRRVVRLERRVQGEWRVLDRERTDTKGRAVLVWRATTTRPVAALRLRVPATRTQAAARSAVHHVQVAQPATPPRPAAVPASTSSRTPTPAPASAPGPTSIPAPGSAPTPAPAPTSASVPVPASTAAAATSADEALRTRLLVLVNEARATARTCGAGDLPAAPALTRDDGLDRAAGDYAVKMAAEGFFAHESPDGSTMSSRLTAAGVRYRSARENIAAGYATADDVVAGWLTSPGHCANLMAADVQRVGFGHATTSTARYGTYWVQDFAG